MRISAGDLTEQIVIQQRDGSRDASGQPAETWIDFATVRARVRPLRVRELLAATAERAPADVEITIRWLDGVTPSMRVQWDTRTFAIVAHPIDIDGAHHTLQILCSSITKEQA
jgi:SPP1 family predicted phage head-tail adaptor